MPVTEGPNEGLIVPSIALVGVSQDAGDGATSERPFFQARLTREEKDPRIIPPLSPLRNVRRLGTLVISPLRSRSSSTLTF